MARPRFRLAGVSSISRCSARRSTTKYLASILSPATAPCFWSAIRSSTRGDWRSPEALIVALPTPTTAARAGAPKHAKKLAATGRYDAVIALGCVIRGATSHFEYVAGSAVEGLSRVALDTGVPIALGVLTTDTIEQAVERAGAKAGNRGEAAALAAIEMTNLINSIDTDKRL